MARPRIHTDVGSAGNIEIYRPTPEMLADAWRRNVAPRSATAWLMGDPAPGQSALDQRQGQRHEVSSSL
jgi:hypothetical protein